jgi:DnaD/phage-associated family protein
MSDRSSRRAARARAYRASWAPTAEAAERHLQKLLHLRTREGEIARLLELPQRPLVEKEQKYIAAWLDWGFDNDALRLAYEKTVMGTASKSMDWRYMNGILRRWHESGWHSVEEVNRGEQRSVPRNNPHSDQTAQSRRDGADWMRRYIKK